MKRKVLVILSNRFQPSQKHRYFELEVKPDGSVLSEKSLRSEPKEPRFDEVWKNDEGKQSMVDCNRFKRFYRHKLEKPS